MRFILNPDIRNKKIESLADGLEKIGTSMRLIYVFYTLLFIILFCFLATHSGSTLAEIGWASLGFFIITGVEYGVHRFLFHHKNPNFFLRKIHSRHHANQNNSAHGVVPIPVSFGLILIVSGPFYFLASSRVEYVALLSGLIVAYIVHETTHYMNHQVKPKTAWGQYFRRYHQYHHVVDSRYNYGFMVPFWDMMFSTYRIEKGDTKK